MNYIIYKPYTKTYKLYGNIVQIISYLILTPETKIIIDDVNLALSIDDVILPFNNIEEMEAQLEEIYFLLDSFFDNKITLQDLEATQENLLKHFKNYLSSIKSKS